MVPEILLGRASHPTLERARVRSDDAVHVGIERARRLDRNGLEVHHEPSVRLPERAGEQQRSLEPEREHGGSARRLRVPAEKRHPRGSESHRPLVDEESDRVLLAHRTRDAPHSVGIVDHRQPDPLARLVEIPIEQRVLHSARHGFERNAARGYIRTAELPIAEVAGYEHHPPTFAEGTLDVLPAVYLLHQREHLLARVGRQERGLDRRPAEVGVRRSSDALHLRLGEPGECGGYLALHHRSPDAERAVPEHADPLPERARPLEAQAAQRGHRGAYSVVLSVVGESGRAHRAAQDDRSPAASAAVANPSIIAPSAKSRWARVRPARPIASRWSPWARNDATVAAVSLGSAGGSSTPAMPSGT